MAKETNTPITPILPGSPKQQEITRAIEDHVRPILSKDARYDVHRPFLMYTTAVCVLKAFVHQINKLVLTGHDGRLNLGPVLGAALSAKAADAEKDGNLNIILYPLDDDLRVTDLKDFIFDGTDPSKQNPNSPVMESLPMALKVRNPMEGEVLKEIDRLANASMMMNHGISYREMYGAVVIGVYFITGAIEYLKQLAAEGKHGFYNLGDVVEIKYTTTDEGKPVLNFAPGVIAKLTIKQDSATETA